MKLLRATVKNYRVIREKSIAFNPNGITAIIGHNESGKSTFFEAIKAALFLSSKIGGDLISNMESNFGGTPEVEVTFLTDDNTEVTIKKIFAGNNAKSSTTLSGLPGGTLTGPEAEEKLATLLNDNEAKISGRGAPGQFEARMPNLFVKQGASIRDPFSAVSGSTQQSLDTALGQISGSLLISDTDAALQIATKSLVDAWFTATRKVQGNGDLKKKEDASAECNDKLQNAKQTLNNIQENKKIIDDNQKIIDRENALLEKLKNDFNTADKKVKDIAKIRATEGPIQKDIELLDQKRLTFTRAQTDIADKQAQLDEDNATQRENEQQLATLTNAETSAKANLENKCAAYTAAAQAERDARNNLNTVNASLDYLDALAAENTATQKADALVTLQENLSKLEDQLKALPPIDASIHKRIHALQDDANTKKAAFEALAACIHVESSPVPVLINGEPLAEHTEILLSQDATLTIGETTLTLKLGGKDGISGAQQAFKDASQSLRQALAEVGCPDISAVDSAWGSIQTIQPDLTRAKTELKKAKPDDVQKLLSAALQKLRSTQAALEARDIPLPTEDTRAALDQQKTDISRSLPTLEETTAKAEKARDGAQSALTNASSDLSKLNQQISKLTGSISSALKSLESLRKEHGTDEDIDAAIAHLNDQITAKNNELTSIQARINEIDPLGTAENELKNIETNITNTQNTITTAQSGIDRNLGVLLSATGGKDPAAELATAQANANRAKEELLRFQKTAAARCLLADTFANAAAQQAHDLNAPLLERITPYLQDIFGRQTSVTLNADKEKDKPDTKILRIVRPNQTDADKFDTFLHDNLSGGAKEQLTIATLLATAEVFATNHGGALPILLDDAFVNSDDDRIVGIKRMLQHAAQKGVQPILFSCTDDPDFARIGSYVHFE